MTNKFKFFRIYAKLPGMNKFKALGGGCLCDNLIHAQIFEFTDSESEKLLKAKLDKKLLKLAADNGGEWKIKKVIEK